MRRDVICLLMLGIVSLTCATGAFSAGLKGDFTNDGDVDAQDLADFASNYGVVDNGCKENTNCTDTSASGSYCAKPAGECTGIGKCADRPEICPDVYMPVCGCDGLTYSNSCDASNAGVNVDYEGECLIRCSETADCKVAGEVCQKKDGNCTGVGECVTRPEACPKLWDPVCGCDGETYANRCYALAAGMNVSSAGECSPDECKDNSTCRDNQLCAKLVGECDGAGKCVDIPDACIEIYDPVCGCDKVTYSNACFAAMAGVNVAFKGPCVSKCLTNDDCGDKGLYCKKAPGSCNNVTLGECQPKPQICPLYFKPVCGCDGITYGNECEAAAAGVTVAHEGMCEPLCYDSSECRAEDFCQKEPGQCRSAGKCAPRPEICAALGLVYAPVCGCDGNTYNNECEAARKGTSIAYKGECKRDPSCDDGTELICATFAEVICKDFEIKAIQNGCYICVNPKTCLPWGVSECGAEKPCPEGERCNECGTSSCPACDDCVGVCEPVNTGTM